MSGNNLHIRMATPADTEKLLTIYESYVLKTAITLEYMVPAVKGFRGRIVHALTRSPYLATIQDGRIVGYAYVSPSKSWATYDQAMEAPTYMDETCQDGDVGARLYEALGDVLRQQNILNPEAYITYPNPESTQFHEKYGYKTMAHPTKYDYKMGIWYDMIWMEKVLGGHPRKPTPVILTTSGVFENLF